MNELKLYVKNNRIGDLFFVYFNSMSIRTFCTRKIAIK